MEEKACACACACNKQIIWFFEEPTIIVCPVCEITFHASRSEKNCPHCGTTLVNFTCDPIEFTQAVTEGDSYE